MKIISVARYKGATYEAELDDGRKLYLHADIITDFGISAGMETDRETLKKIVYALMITLTLAIAVTSYLLTMALNGHASMHALHLMHLDWSMTCCCLTVPVMAPTGQLRAHLVQPLQASVMTS